MGCIQIVASLTAAYGELQDGEGESEKSYQAGTVSNGLDDIKVLEPPGEMPPAELLSTRTKRSWSSAVRRRFPPLQSRL
ncbi:GL20680 [Drosophila persimilis]|uniref:GL20680 n=1 Tax=Drosophila persimilis TaxID=7234 RepID=B4H2T2_DROPE|nr:GL26895 [Drosophila persimilis]EDW39956.1 GL20680 [Drosophila persimilis]